MKATDPLLHLRLLVQRVCTVLDTGQTNGFWFFDTHIERHPYQVVLILTRRDPGMTKGNKLREGSKEHGP